MDFGVKRPLFGKEIPMRTVNEVSKLTGVSIRTLQYYDSIGLLKPTEYTEVGYCLYDEEALERLQQILLFRELEFPLKEIKDIIYNPKFNKEKVLEQQIELLVLKKEHIENLIDFARRIKTMGVNKTDFKVFDKISSQRIITPVQKKFYQVWERCMQVAENLPKTLIAMVEKELLCLQQKQLRYIVNKRAQLSVILRDEFEVGGVNSDY